jgi:hypothetical protein
LRLTPLQECLALPECGSFNIFCLFWYAFDAAAKQIGLGGMMITRRSWICILTMIAILVPSANLVSGQESKPVALDERAAMIKEQNWLRVLRAFERESRHLYYLQSNAMLSAYGGWSEGDFTYGDHILLVKEAGEIIAENVNRLRYQLERGKWGAGEDIERLAEAVAQMQTAIGISIEISDLLRAGDLALANAAYRERSEPLFKSIWASNSTLVSGAERRFPRR